MSSAKWLLVAVFLALLDHGHTRYLRDFDGTWQSSTDSSTIQICVTNDIFIDMTFDVYRIWNAKLATRFSMSDYYLSELPKISDTAEFTFEPTDLTFTSRHKRNKHEYVFRFTLINETSLRLMPDNTSASNGKTYTKIGPPTIPDRKKISGNKNEPVVIAFTEAYYVQMKKHYRTIRLFAINMGRIDQPLDFPAQPPCKYVDVSDRHPLYRFVGRWKTGARKYMRIRAFDNDRISMQKFYTFYIFNVPLGEPFDVHHSNGEKLKGLITFDGNTLLITVGSDAYSLTIRPKPPAAVINDEINDDGGREDTSIDWQIHEDGIHRLENNIRRYESVYTAYTLGRLGSLRPQNNTPLPIAYTWDYVGEHLDINYNVQENGYQCGFDVNLKSVDMELNVKQSGIERRIFTTTFQKSRSDKVNKRVHELYLRNDIPCGVAECANCKFSDFSALAAVVDTSASAAAPFRHVLVLDGFSVLKFVDVLGEAAFKSVIIPQSAWNYVKKLNPSIYKRMNSLYVENGDRFFVFLNEFVSETFVDPGINRVPELYQEKCLLKFGNYLKAHWAGLGVRPLIICSDGEAKCRLSAGFSDVLTLYEYTNGIKGCEKLSERIKDLCSIDHTRGHALYPAHWSQDRLLDGLSSGKLKKGKFQLSMENYLEAYVTFERGEQWFIKGRPSMNRAVHGDIVVARLLPSDEWTSPEKAVRLRDAEEAVDKTAGDDNGDTPADVEDQDDDGASRAKRPRVDVVPTAEIVGILRRNWRNYCGIILAPHVEGQGERRFLFAPSERLIPRIRIETSHYEQLRGKKLLVQIDSWPQDSHYPKGHYIREIGAEGERRTEEEVIMLEHEIPHGDWTPAVKDCLPTMPWRPEPSNYRIDLTHLDVCSVDPEGCTDIDDALHCVDLGDGRYEVGVHIADVTHFVRPGTAMDQEAAERSTTVYLCGRRVDMLPDLLSSNLCSLRENEPRYAFSVIWLLKWTPPENGSEVGEVSIENVKCVKSIIRSRRAFTYQLAQEQIDNVEFKDNITESLRNLMKLSICLKSKRKVMGALELASAEIRFDVDRKTGKPLKVNEKQHIPSMSMIEEFMLLANVTVAEKILEAFPDSAVLRRHPIPAEDSFKPIIEMARTCNFELNVSSGKELSKSLEGIERECHGDDGGVSSRSLAGRMLRMLTTRCMTQAIYFAAGTISADQYLHYGLAAKVYTHFTSPIRRYADVMVHRLLANLIGIDPLHETMTNRKRLIRQTENMNKRHRQAQYASRASVLLNTFLMVKDHPESEITAIVIGLRNNAIQVTVPKYGLDAYIFFDRKGDVDQTEKEKISPEQVAALVQEKIRLFQKITVSLKVKEVNQRRIFDVTLINPNIPGLSGAVTDCDPEALQSNE